MALEKPGKLGDFLFLLLCGHPALVWSIVCWNLFQAGKTAFHYAAANGYAWVVIDVLLRYDAEMERCENGDEGPHSDRRYDPDRPDNMGNTAIMLAVRRNHVQVWHIAFLLSQQV